jgi:hypothetical protein
MSVLRFVTAPVYSALLALWGALSRGISLPFFSPASQSREVVF